MITLYCILYIKVFFLRQVSRSRENVINIMKVAQGGVIQIYFFLKKVRTFMAIRKKKEN